MEDIKTNNVGFIKHVFDFSQDSKEDMLNIVQYSLLAIIPIVILNKLIQRYIPEADDAKSSLEILMEVVFQILIIFVGLLFVNRIVTYLPTYSGAKYPDFHATNTVLATLVIILSLQTKLGEKISILVERIVELWEGKKPIKTSGAVNVTQPLSGGMAAPLPPAGPPPPMMIGNGATSLDQLPTTQPQPNYDSMYRQGMTPMAPSGAEGFQSGVQAANAVLSGSWGSANW